MGKIDWTQIRIAEEWTSINPSDLNAIAAEQERIKTLSTLILKAFKRHQLAKAKQLKQRSTASEQRMGE